MALAAIGLGSILTDRTKINLVSALRNLDITVPLRTEGRRYLHVERWSSCSLVSTLAEHDLLCYPVSLTHRDRPDFLLQCREKKVGVEATEAIPKQYAECLALAERKYPDSSVELGHFRWGAPRLSTEEMHELLRQKQRTARPWTGDQPEREWALWIYSRVEEKLLGLAEAEFEKFPENWLAIYDNLPLPPMHLEKAIGFLLPALESTWTNIPGFHAIYIEHGPVIVKLTPNETTYMGLHNLW